jgi:hypothetical protein
MQPTTSRTDIRHRRRPTRRSAVFLAATALLMTACTSVVNGAAFYVPGPPPPGGVDLTLLDTGNYPTKPQPPLGQAGTASAGSLIDAAHMASFVVGPWEIDARLSDSAEPTLSIKDAAAITEVESQPLADAAGRHHFINGFASTRKSKDNEMSVVNAVLRFPDPGAAADAAKEFGALAAKPDPSTSEVTTPPQPAPVPNHPETLAISSTLTEFDNPKPVATLRAYTPHGPYVFMQWSQTPDGPDAAMALMVKAIDLQGPAIDKFKPADPADFPTLQRDPDGLLARTIPAPPDTALVTQNQVYDQPGALQFQDNAINSTQAFTDSGMDQWANGKTGIYRARDAAGASHIVEQFIAELQLNGAKPAAGVPHMDASRCVELTSALGNSYACYATYDRYTIEAQSQQPADAQQLAAATYAILSAK